MTANRSHLRIASDELSFSFARSSGPGGQNVNKVNSKAVLRWKPATTRSLPDAVRDRFLTRYAQRLTTAGELILTGQRHRDQGRNVADCLTRLQELIAAVARPPRPRKATRPSRSSIERRLEGKRVRSGKKSARRRVDEE